MGDLPWNLGAELLTALVLAAIGVLVTIWYAGRWFGEREARRDREERSNG